jgi:xylan 1,4-beta-xylosidase
MNRRQVMTTLAGGALTAGCGFSAMAEDLERQPSGDLGNGYYKNPIIVAGDIADIGSIRVGGDYYLVNYYTCAPGRPIWHSRDLIHWQPAVHMVKERAGGGDLAVYEGRFYHYGGGRGGISVRQAENPLGPWSDPVIMPDVKPWDLTHVSGPDGRRWLLSGFQEGNVYEISKEGTKVLRGPIKMYDGWPIPKDWDIECPCMEGWNAFYRDGYYYLTAAQGGTSGPPTAHMVVAARAKEMTGPWENSPYNPIIHTYKPEEPFWAQGNGRLIETPQGEWFMFYHTYRKGHFNLGRNIMLVPIEWTKDGWFRVPPGLRVDQPIRKPKGGEALPHGYTLSDDFKGPELDIKWGFPAQSAEGRYSFGNDGLHLKGSGANMAECIPMVMPCTHPAYEYVVEMTVPPGLTGGATVFYEPRAYSAIGLTGGLIRPYIGYSRDINYPLPYQGSHVFFRMVFQNDLVRMFFSPDGSNWTKIPSTGEVSGLHRNSMGTWCAMRPGIFAFGSGEVVVHNFRLKGLA